MQSQDRLLLGLPVSTPVVVARAAPVVIADFVHSAAPVVIVEAGTVVIAKASTVVIAEADSSWDSWCRAEADSYSCCQGRLLLGLPVSTSAVVAMAVPVVIDDFVDSAAPVVIVKAGTAVIVGVVAIARAALL